VTKTVDRKRLEGLYQEARGALKAREYDRAAKMLTEILAVDESYLEASGLLARAIRLKRRRWYNDLRLWGAAAGLAAIGLIAWLAHKGAEQSPTAPFTPAAATMISASPAAAGSPTPTYLPLVWKRIAIGQEFPRDRIRAVAISTSDHDVIYVGTDHAGIYKTIDGGRSWVPMNHGLESARILSLAVAPSNHDLVLAGTTHGGLYRTIDGGERWEKVDVFVDFWAWIEDQSLVVANPVDPNHFVWYGGGSTMESLDGGETWSVLIHRFCGDWNKIAAFTFDHSNDHHMLIAGNGQDQSCPAGIYESSDGGKNWEFSRLELEEVQSTGLLSSQDPQGSAFTLATGYRPSLDRYGTYIRTKSDDDWNLLTDSRFDYLDQLTAGPDGCVYGVYGSLIFRTHDGGNRWELAGELPTTIDNTTAPLAVSQRDAQILRYGRFLSQDGGRSWVEQMDGIPAGPLMLYPDSAHPTELFACRNGLKQEGKWDFEDYEDPLFRSIDGGKSWRLLFGPGHGLALDGNGSALYRGGIDAIWYSPDRGVTWQERRSPVLDGFSLVAAPSTAAGTVFAMQQRHGISTSRDYGATWALIVEAEIDGVLHFSPATNQVYMLYYNNGNRWTGSQDGGFSWPVLGPALHGWGFSSAQNNLFSRLAIHPANDEMLFLATWGMGILVSDNGGLTWESSNTGISTSYINSLSIDLLNPATIYSGTESGAYVSFDSGGHWHPINDGLLGVDVVYSIVIDSQGSVYAATPYGIFVLEQK
jgi:photosystem II stability/assembly factor-like uncharacterized protein